MKVKTWNNQFIEVDIPENTPGNLIALPALIDPHVHFRTPGAEHKENWVTGSQAAIAGGVGTVFDMPNNTPSIIDARALEQKKDIIDEQLQKSGIPLNYKLWFGTTPNNLDEVEKVKDKIIGIKLFMGSSTGDLLVDEEGIQEKWFKKASELNLPIAVHAEDEDIIKNLQLKILNPTISDHSRIRPPEAAEKAVRQSINLARKYNTKLYILHLSTAGEIELVRQAKKDGVKVYAEVAPHHLFLDESYYEKLGTKAQMNPPLRSSDHIEALWKGIEDGTIDTIGTDHAPHTLEEKNKKYPNSPSGIPGLETYLPLLLDAYNKNKISLEKIVKLTSTNAQTIFDIINNNNWTIVDLDLEHGVKDEDLKTKCSWSSFTGRKLKGSPIATTLNNKIYKINQ